MEDGISRLPMEDGITWNPVNLDTDTGSPYTRVHRSTHAAVGRRFGHPSDTATFSFGRLHWLPGGRRLLCVRGEMARHPEQRLDHRLRRLLYISNH